MLAFLAPLVLKLSPIGKILKAIPWWVYATAALVAVVGIHLYRDGKQERAAYRSGAAAGYTRAMNEVEAKARKIAAMADTIAARIRSKNDEDARVIADRADDLRLRGPGLARCTYAVPPASTGGRQPDSGRADAPPIGLPVEERAAVPWPWLVRQAEVCDLNRNEVLSWREWRTKLVDTLAKPEGAAK